MYVVVPWEIIERQPFETFIILQVPIVLHTAQMHNKNPALAMCLCPKHKARWIPEAAEMERFTQEKQRHTHKQIYFYDPFTGCHGCPEKEQTLWWEIIFFICHLSSAM